MNFSHKNYGLKNKCRFDYFSSNTYNVFFKFIKNVPSKIGEKVRFQIR